MDQDWDCGPLAVGRTIKEYSVCPNCPKVLGWIKTGTVALLQ